MKQIIAMLLAVVMVLGLYACASLVNRAPAGHCPHLRRLSAEHHTRHQENPTTLRILEAAAKAEGELVIDGSCEDPYIAAAANAFADKYGITTSWQRLTGGAVQAKVEEENEPLRRRLLRRAISIFRPFCAAQGLAGAPRRRERRESALR